MFWQIHLKAQKPKNLKTVLSKTYHKFIGTAKKTILEEIDNNVITECYIEFSVIMNYWTVKTQIIKSTFYNIQYVHQLLTYNKFIDKIKIILNTILWLDYLNYAKLNSLYVLNDFRLVSHASTVYSLGVLGLVGLHWYMLIVSSMFCTYIKLFREFVMTKLWFYWFSVIQNNIFIVGKESRYYFGLGKARKSACQKFTKMRNIHWWKGKISVQGHELKISTTKTFWIMIISNSLSYTCICNVYYILFYF